MIGWCSGAYAQKTVTGTVTDERGEEIIGASVVVQGTTKGTISDISGRFSIDVPENGILVVSYIGYQTGEIPVGSKTDLLIQLKESTSSLDEVVVVGYGTQKKASLTSAISQISGAEAFKDRGISNISVALQGEIPGLVVTRSSTRPGSEGAAMKIRGDISVNGNSSPLVLIDGLAGSLDELNQMESNDIENIAVLKDASAAIYGARSASGVLLVTTKRGKKGGAKITYSGSISTTVDGIQMPITTNAQWLDMFYDAQYRDAMTINPTVTDPAEIEKRMNWWIFATNSVLSGVDVNTGQATGDLAFWQRLRNGETMTIRRSNGWIHRYEPNKYIMDELYGQATSHKHSLSISGADDKFGYMASLGFADNQSQLKVADDGEKKYSGRLNMDYQATKILKFEAGMSYEKRDVTTPSADVGAGWADPWWWAFYSQDGSNYDSFDGKRSPLGGLKDGGQVKTGFTTLRTNLKATLDLSALTQGLSLSATGGYKSVGKDIQKSVNKVQYYDWENNPTGNKNGPGSLTEEMNTWTNTTLGAFANYDRTFNKVHTVNAMLGVTAEEENWKKVTASRNSGPLYENSGLVDLDAMISGTNNEAVGGQSSWAFLSYITRLNYNYGNKYIVEFMGRRDGSSKRLMDKYKNIEHIENKKDSSYILIEPDIQGIVDQARNGGAVLNIYRVGYSSGDKKDIPLKTFEIPQNIINRNNIYQPHTFYIEVVSGNAKVYMDATGRDNLVADLTLNPLGRTDKIAFPVLGDVGFSAEISNVEIRNFRSPSNVIRKITSPLKQPVFNPSQNSMPLLRTGFKVKQNIAKAKLYITARGIYEPYLNGNRIGNDYFNPGHTQYNKTLLYQVYDVTGFLK
ncbi:MAG: SusC/RagA family TonB-linked outer membrane protein, partial [Dysgonamonadaceae bacterium]|nr:SusC/RagA family TonB-linked outer membrane protein [Dysgonamonadaceae bacterium]